MKYYNSIARYITRYITNNKIFRKTLKSFLTNKVKYTSRERKDKEL